LLKFPKSTHHINNVLQNLIMLNAKRVTIMIDDDLDKKIRILQAKKIQKENSSVSYSRMINDCLRKKL